MRVLWFQDIQTPLRLGDAEALTLCQAVYTALKRGTPPDTAIGSLPGADTPRAFFLSWSDGTTSASTHLGMGPTAADALREACRRAQASTPALQHLLWLKLDVVQRGEAVTNFSPRQSRLPLPSLLGLAFGPAAGFEFLPEHLISWDMVDPTSQMSIHYITERVIGQEYARYLPESERLPALSRWTALTSHLGGQKACLFEPQSYFFDGSTCTPLFRGHPLGTEVAVAELRQSATAAGDRLVEYCTEQGLFECPLPEWELGQPKDAEPRDQAEAILALVRLHQATGEERYLAAAQRAGTCLAAAVVPYGGSPRAGCLPEIETVSAAPRVEAQARLTLTATNALAVTALCELSSAAKTQAYHPVLAMLAQHLVLQLQPDASVVQARQFPSQQLHPLVESESAATTLLAFMALYESVAREVFLTHAVNVASWLRRTALAAEEMDGLPRDVWLMEALDRLYTFTRDEGLKEPVGRLALAASLDQSREVDYPDAYGAVSGHISALPAADRSRLIAIGARLLHDLGQPEISENLLGEARPYVLFQLQTRITPPVAMYLPEPHRYLGLFRDHVLDYGFELRGQAAQILSLLALARVLEQLGRNTLPADIAVDKGLVEARNLLSRWPRYLTPRVAALAAQETAGQTIEFHDLGSQMLTIRPPEAEGKPGKTGKRQRQRSPFVPIQPAKP
jgi:hypothetical protein